MIDRDEAREWYVRFLLHKVRHDTYPSSTYMDLIERWIPRKLVDDYLEVLVEKVSESEFPSIDLLHRIRCVIARLPRHDHDDDHDRRRRQGRDDDAGKKDDR